MDAGDTRIQVEVAAVVGCLWRLSEIQPEVAQSFIDGQRLGDANHCLIRQLLGLSHVPFKQQPTDLRNRLRGRRVGAVTLLAGPDGVLVELDMLLAGDTKNHGRQTPVAHGQSLIPVGGGLPVPERQRIFRLGKAYAGARESHKRGNFQ